MSNDDIYSRLTAIIVNALRVKPEKVTPEARLFLDLGAESLDILDIRFQIENVFGFRIDQDEIVNTIAAAGSSAEEIYEQFTVARMAAFVADRLAVESSR